MNGNEWKKEGWQNGRERGGRMEGQNGRERGVRMEERGVPERKREECQNGGRVNTIGEASKSASQAFSKKENHKYK